jgi:TetR/AcrR family transcriptional regulator, repressor for neighboring sulfatase
VTDTRKSRRPRRSREEVSQALIDAAAELFSERPSGHVTVREIAARADVNPALIHRYFGTKDDLMRAAIEKSQLDIASQLAEVRDIRADIDLLYQAVVGDKEFIAVLARASLDGVLPELPAGYPTMTGLLRRLESERAGKTGPGPHDLRVVVACLGALTMGYALFGNFLRQGTGLVGESEDYLEEAIVDVARAIITAAIE